MEKGSLFSRILRWFFKPRAIKIPLVLWIVLLTSILASFIVLLTRPTPLPIEREIERVVIITATPPPSTWYIPTPVPGAPPITPTPVGSGGTLVLRNVTQGTALRVAHQLTPRQVEIVLAGGVLAMAAA